MAQPVWQGTTHLWGRAGVKITGRRPLGCFHRHRHDFRRHQNRPKWRCFIPALTRQMLMGFTSVVDVRRDHPSTSPSPQSYRMRKARWRQSARNQRERAAIIVTQGSCPAGLLSLRHPKRLPTPVCPKVALALSRPTAPASLYRRIDPLLRSTKRSFRR